MKQPFPRRLAPVLLGSWGQAAAVLFSVGLMLNLRSAAPLASLSLAGRFSPVWEGGEGGEGWCWTPSTAGEEHRSQEASALPRGQGQRHPHHPSASSALLPPPRQRAGLRAGQRGGCSRRSSPHPPAPASLTRQARRPSGVVELSLPPRPAACSVLFLNTPVHSAAYSPPGLAAPISLSNCSLRAHGRDVGCWMQDVGCGTPASSPSPAPRWGGMAIPTCHGRVDSEVPPGPEASMDRSRSH